MSGSFNSYVMLHSVDIVLPFQIAQDAVFCKSIIYEYAVKMNLTLTYDTSQSAATLPTFVSSLVLNGVTYVGDAGKSKKEAEQFAARSAILSILGKVYRLEQYYDIPSK